jgi:ribosomal protein L35AE/L33A
LAGWTIPYSDNALPNKRPHIPFPLIIFQTSNYKLTPLPLLSRLYTKGRFLGYKRAKRNTRPNTSLIQIEGVATKEDAQFYLGKRIAYVYRAKREIQGSKVRVIWGCVCYFTWFSIWKLMFTFTVVGVLPVLMGARAWLNQNSE